MEYVLDASAIVAYLRGEPEGTVMRELLIDPDATCYAHAMNLCEVYYESVGQSNAAEATATVTSLFTDGVIARRDMSRRFWQRVGDHKARGRISRPDCFCIALAEELSAEVVTSDHGEFDRLLPLELVPIKFIR